MELGYVPMEDFYVSNTLEYAYDNWCLSQLAKALDKTDLNSGNTVLLLRCLPGILVNDNN